MCIRDRAKEIVNGPFESIRAKDGEIIDLGGVNLQTLSLIHI